jgi:Bacterial SH3 domain
MSMRMLFIVAAVAMALIFVAPLQAAPLAQEAVGEVEVEVTSSSTFTLTVRLDEVTTFVIPMQVDWRAQGPSAGSADELLVEVLPTVLRTGIFSVTVGAVEPTTGTLAFTLTQPAEETVAITQTGTTTATATTTGTETTTTPPTTTEDIPPENATTVNTVANLRAGPGTDYALVGSAAVGDVVEVVGQNADGTWLILADGAWVAAFLIDNIPVDLPVVEPTATPVPAPPAPDILTPTVTPTPTSAP